MRWPPRDQRSNLMIRSRYRKFPRAEGCSSGKIVASKCETLPSDCCNASRTRACMPEARARRRKAWLARTAGRKAESSGGMNCGATNASPSLSLIKTQVCSSGEGQVQVLKMGHEGLESHLEVARA